MNDDEPVSPDKPVEMRDVRLIDPEYEDEAEFQAQKDERGAHEFSSVALSVARNDHDDIDDDDSDCAPLDSQASDQPPDADLQLINEQVREGGLPLSENTIRAAKVLLPDGAQVYQTLD